MRDMSSRRATVCVVKYMIRKMWSGFVEGLPWCGLVILLAAVGTGAGYAFVAICKWLGVEPELLFGLCVAVLAVFCVTYQLVDLYREARRHCEE